jgi:hypothetical protein
MLDFAEKLCLWKELLAMVYKGEEICNEWDFNVVAYEKYVKRRSNGSAVRNDKLSQKDFWDFITDGYDSRKSKYNKIFANIKEACGSVL